MVGGVRGGERRLRRGYTILELVVIVVIIGMAAAVTIPMAGNALDASRDQQVEVDLQVIRSAMLSYYYDVRVWPPDGAAGQDPGLILDGLPKPQGWRGPYLVNLPTAPRGWTGYKWNNSGTVLSISSSFVSDPSRIQEVFLRR